MKSKMLVMVLGMALCAMPAMAQLNNSAPHMQDLTVDEAAYFNANAAMEISYTALTVTATNTAQVFTNAIGAGKWVQLMGAKCVQAFDTGNTNYTGSLVLTVGDSSGGTNLLNAMQLASDSTAVGWKPGGITVNTLSNSAGVVTGTYYPSGGNLFITLTPNLNEACASNVRGKVRIYFQTR